MRSTRKIKERSKSKVAKQKRGAPNVVIPPQHRADFGAGRPSAPIINTSRKSAPSEPVVHRGGYDTEMDLPEYKDAKLQAQMAEFEKNVMSVSPQHTLESAHQQFEKNVQASKGQRWDGQERWQGKENEEMRLVNIISPVTFMKQLAKAGVRIALEPEANGSPRNARIWLNDFVRVQRVGLNVWVEGEAQTITSLQYPWSPEWSIMRFNEYGVPTNERYRGWRTVLLTLIIKDVITEDEARAAFGEPIGPAATFYRKQLFEHRAMNMAGVQTKVSEVLASYPPPLPKRNHAHDLENR
jgi:hypothetical protein